MTTNAELGERVHQAMWKRRITQLKLADALGLSQATVSKKIHGERPWFALELIGAANFLGITLDDLCGESNLVHVGARQRFDLERLTEQTPELSVDHGAAGEECAVRDSNPEPAD